MASDGFLKLKSLRPLFAEAEAASDEQRIQELDAEEKRLMNELQGDEFVQYLIEEFVEKGGIDRTEIENYFNEICSSADPAIRKAFFQGWSIGATQIPPFTAAMLEEQLSEINKTTQGVIEQIDESLDKMQRHEKWAKGMATKPNIKGPDTLQ